MKILSAIPVQMKGRGHPECVPIECECGCVMLREHRLGPEVTCPDCTATADFSDDEAFKPHNGQHR